MITKTTSMDIGRLEVMSQSVHWQQWSITCLITKVVLKLTAGQLRTAIWLCSDKLSMLLTAQVMAHEWEGKTTKVTTTTETSNNGIRILTSHLHLLLCFKTNYSLMKSHMIEYRTQSILTSRSCCSQLYCLTDSSTERTRMMRIASNNVLTRTSTHGRRTLYSGSEGTHDAGAIRLLLHSNLNLIYSSLQSV